MADSRTEALEIIRTNIALYGYHLYIVGGSCTPRFAYTIGLSPVLGRELILAGAVEFFIDDVVSVVAQVVEQLKEHAHERSVRTLTEEFGALDVVPVHRSWGTKVLLGALDFYSDDEIDAWQIIPDFRHWTIDVPDMSLPWTSDTSGGWRWLADPWVLPVPRDSTATTNLAALRGNRVTEAARWEENDWELFAGAGREVDEKDTRVVPIGVLLEWDGTMSRVLELEVGTGVWRDQFSDWHEWKRKGEPS